MNGMELPLPDSIPYGLHVIGSGTHFETRRGPGIR
jgi:hypothetical protein